MALDLGSRLTHRSRRARQVTNGRLEGLNRRIRLFSHRSFGFHSAAPLVALVYLLCAAITIHLPR